jgi:hypothetical protein
MLTGKILSYCQIRIYLFSETNNNTNESHQPWREEHRSQQIRRSDARQGCTEG